jgi:hypothetical protein
MNWIDDLSKSVVFAIFLLLIGGTATVVWMVATVIYMIIHHGG